MHPAKILATGLKVGYEFVYKRILLRDWAVKPRIIVPFYAISRQYMALSLYSATQGNFTCLLKGALGGCVSPPATVAGFYSPLGHWRWPQAQNASQPTTTLDSPLRDFLCLGDNWEWRCFHGSGKNIDNDVHIYWSTWHIEPELQWQVRQIQKLHSDWNSTHVIPKRRRKQCTLSTAAVSWLTTMTRLRGLPTEDQPAPGPVEE